MTAYCSGSELWPGLYSDILYRATTLLPRIVNSVEVLWCRYGETVAGVTITVLSNYLQLGTISILSVSIPSTKLVSSTNLNLKTLFVIRRQYAKMQQSTILWRCPVLNRNLILILFLQLRKTLSTIYLHSILCYCHQPLPSVNVHCETGTGEGMWPIYSEAWSGDLWRSLHHGGAAGGQPGTETQLA